MNFSKTNKVITRSTFIAVLFGAAFLAGCDNSSGGSQKAGIPEGALVIQKQGIFSSGGTVTEPLPGKYDETKNWLDLTRAGNTAHVDHANVMYQIPANDNGHPIVYLHGYGQSRMGWMTTFDGREGWSEIFLRKGYAAFLVDQPRRGEAGASVHMPNVGGIDAGGTDGKMYLPGDQAWFTHGRIGRIAPEPYEGSQFPKGEEALNQYYRQGTPNTGDYDEKLFGSVLGDVMKDVRRITGNKAIYVTHSQGGRVGWQTPVENISAIVAIEPGFAPNVGSEEYKKLLDAKIPIVFYFGDYIENGPKDIESTTFWQNVLAQCKQFAEAYTKDGGDATVIELPKIGIKGNSHSMFQEMNNKEIADHIEKWLESKGL